MAYDQLTQSIIANAKARASMDAMTENFSKIIDLEPQINAEYSQIELLRKEYTKATGNHKEGRSPDY